MTVERESAGFALPFAAGTAATVYAWASSGSVYLSLFILSGTAFTWLMLLLPERKRWKDAAVRTIIAALAAFTGALCGTMASETSVSDNGNGMLAEAAGHYGCMLESAADRIPFEDKRTNAFVKAVLTGERNGISAEVTEAFRESGASHILALSGLHLGVIYMMIGRLLGFLGAGLTAVRIRSLLTVGLCGFYTLATGAGPSLVRAFLFIFLNETARLTGRHRSTGQTLMAALVIHLCVSPEDISSVGFQLSYAAMAGIAFIWPYLKNIWPKEDSGSLVAKAVSRPMQRIWDSLTMSIACQATTGPLAYMYFGTFPKYFLLTNLIALPLTGMIIPAGAITLILNEAGKCPDLLIHVTEWLTGQLIRALEIVSAM